MGLTHTDKMTDERLKIPKEWINIGDINPKRHGGIFVKWERDMWRIIETIHPDSLPDGMTDDEWLFEQFYCEPSELFKEPEKPHKGLTEWSYDQLDSISQRPYSLEPFKNPSELPENETIEDYTEWLLNNHAETLVCDFVYSFISYYGTHDHDFNSDYWGYLEKFGIEKQDF